MLIDYTFDKCANKINTARILRGGQELFCQQIESFVAAIKYFKETYPEESMDFIDDVTLDKLKDKLVQIRANIRDVDKIFNKIELLEHTRSINLWFKQLQIEDIEFPELSFPRTSYQLPFNGEYIEAKEIFERD